MTVASTAIDLTEPVTEIPSDELDAPDEDSWEYTEPIAPQVPDF